VYSFSSQHADTGMWGVYAGCLPAKADEVLSICRDEIAKVISGGLTDDELSRGKGQLRGSIVLGLEDPSSRMSRLGKAELVYPRLEPVEEILAAIEAVTADDVREIAGAVLYLCSDLAGNVTGTQLVVDGGRSGAGGATARRSGQPPAQRS